MLFYSYYFILLFLPFVWVVFFGSAHLSRRLAIAWLAAASLFFYGYWNPYFVWLIVASITFNYAVAYRIARRRDAYATRASFVMAIAVNLAVLGYFKYTNFFISTGNALLHRHWALADVLLPLGISIFTFTQIAFISDVYRGVAREYSYLNYFLFVTYFPHLIAGPIIHHRQIMPQFEDPQTYRVRTETIARGLIVFAIGLAKKTVLAASFAEYADPVFDAVKHGAQPGAVAAWTGALAYTLQIYFDFSGYSDMAIGLSQLFGVRLPENFNSPYKAHDIVEFWRRWNMTLSAFLRDYLYIPLGGNRRGPLRRYVNLFITMLLGGLWHGANWTFVAWGGLHGVYLVANHLWRGVRRRPQALSGPAGMPARLIGTATTFVAVVVAWVFFRAESFDNALAVLGGMTHWQDLRALLSMTPGVFNGMLAAYLFPPDAGWYRSALFASGFGLIWLAPTTREVVSGLRLGTLQRSSLAIGAVVFWVLLFAAISASRQVGEFIYFNF